MIKTTLNKYQAYDIVKGFSENYNNQYSIQGFDALFDYMESYSEEIGEELEFDFIAWCCDYTEYKSAWEAMEQYQPDDMPTVDIEDEDGTGKDLVKITEESEKLALEWLNENTTVIEFDGGIIVQNF